MRLLSSMLSLAFTFSAMAGPSVIDRMITAYGGRKAIEKVHAVRETGRVDAIMRGTSGTVTRTFARPDRLAIEVAYPASTERRVVDHQRGWHDGEEVAGARLEAMILQAARIDLPWILLERRDAVRERGTLSREGRELLLLEIPLENGLSLSLEVDAATLLVARSIGTLGANAPGMSFEAVYSDYRKVDGVMFAFHEQSFAGGRLTGETTLEAIVTNPPIDAGTFGPDAAAARKRT